MANGYKTGGRQRGTPNRITTRVREYVSEIIEMELDNVPKLLDQLEPKERLEILIKLLPYATPKIDASIWERIA